MKILPCLLCCLGFSQTALAQNKLSDAPKMLLIGGGIVDEIITPVSTSLQGKADIVRAQPAAESAFEALSHRDGWLEREKPRVIWRAHGLYYFSHGLLKHFDTEGVLSLIAPRPFLALTGDHRLQLACRWHSRAGGKDPLRLSHARRGGSFPKHRLSRHGPRLYPRDAPRNVGVV